MSVSDEILKRTADAYRRIRNTARFLLANLNDFDPATDLVAASEMLPLDRWAVDQAAQVQDKVLSAYEQFPVPPDCAGSVEFLYGGVG